MAQVFRYLKDSAGVKLSAVAKTATFNSEALRLAGLDIFGIHLKISAVSGTSASLAVKVQTSYDGGTTWLDTYADGENSASQAALAAITTTTEVEEHWPCWFAGPDRSDDGLDPRARFVFTITGTSPSFTIRAILVGRSYGR